MTALDASCPGAYCGNDAVNTEPLVDSANVCPNLVPETLSTFKYLHNGVNYTLIELRGPSDPLDAADLVIAAPHGGDLRDEVNYFIEDRATSGSYCPDGCKTSKDSYTKEIAELLQTKFISNFCKVPYLVINHLHRSKLDANREIGEAAQGNAIAEEAWTNFHTFINRAQLDLRARFGTSTVTTSRRNSKASKRSGKTGINALLFDMHGYGGWDWDPNNGGPFIQWGYRFSTTSLEYCPLDSRSKYSIGTMTHGRWIPGNSYECLVRGPGSLGSRVADLLDETGGLVPDTICGHGLPSEQYPSPETTANDPAFCSESPNDDCHYYSGGFDVNVHERMNWQDEDNLSGDHMNTVQAELPRCIRFGTSSVRETFADKLSVAVMSFCRDLYGPMS